MYLSMGHKKFLVNIFLFIATLLLVTGFPSNQVLAQSGVIISTPYPGIEVKAGETVEFPLKIENYTRSPQKIDLKIISSPDNWEWALEGNGRSVDKLFVDSGSSENARLRVDIPADAEEGMYQLIIEARGTNVSDRLAIDMHIRKDAKKDSKISAEYPDLEGTASTTFKFKVDLTNNSSQIQSYSLSANAPRGWQVTFSPAYSSEKIASINVEPNKNQGLEINIEPPNLIVAGEYIIPITAKSAVETLKLDLKVIIKGTYKVNLTTPTNRLSEDAYAGKPKEIKLIISNTGSSDLRDIEMRSWEPKNWEVEFKPKEIDLIKIGEDKEIKAYVKPDSKALAGDYVVKLTASTPEDSSSAEFRITVKTSTAWGLVGGMLIIGLAGGIYYIFNKYGRR